MSPDDRWRLRHMTDAAEQALAFVQGRKRADLDTDAMLRLRPAPIAGATSRGAREGLSLHRGRCCGPECSITQRHLTITLQPAWRAALRDAGTRARGRGCQSEVFNCESPGAFFSRLSERRWALVRALQGQHAIAIRELARRVGRDVRRVHEGARVLIELGLIERGAAGGVACPFDEVRIDMRMQAEPVHAA